MDDMKELYALYALLVRKNHANDVHAAMAALADGSTPAPELRRVRMALVERRNRMFEFRKTDTSRWLMQPWDVCEAMTEFVDALCAREWALIEDQVLAQSTHPA